MLPTKKNKLTKQEMSVFVIMILFGLPLMFLVFDKKTEESEQRMERYPILDNRTPIEGRLVNIQIEQGFSNKCARYIDLSNGTRFSPSYLTANYLYKPHQFDFFLQERDSISKKADSDSIFVYRDSQKYYFILDTEINKKAKK